MNISAKLGRVLAKYLQKPSRSHAPIATCKPELLAATIKAGDVLLVDGSSRISKAIKYLTQSTWSHAAMCVVDASNSDSVNCNDVMLIEADVVEGVRLIPLANYAHLHTRICRPVGLTEEDITQAIDFIRARVGNQYDTKNVFDLVRYLFQTPPVPTRWRRRMISLGSGDPTRAICSSLIAQTFQSIRYPILPDVFFEKAKYQYSYDEVLHIRHHTLFVPRDFDISPYFKIIKPTLTEFFDPHKLVWSEHQENQV